MCALRHAIASRLTSWIAVAEVPSVDPREPVRAERVPQALPYGMSAEGLGLHELADGAALRMGARSMPMASPRRFTLGAGRSAPLAPEPQQGPPTSSAKDALEELAESLRKPLDEAREMAHREIERLQRLVSELEEFAANLLRDLRRLDVPTKEARTRRHVMLEHLERLARDAHDASPLARPLMVVAERLGKLIRSLERETPSQQPLMLRGQVLPTPSRPTTTIEIFMTSDLDWAPGSEVTIANGSVDVVESGTTRRGEISAGSVVRVELHAAPDLVARSGHVEIQNGNTTLAVTLKDAD